MARLRVSVAGVSAALLLSASLTWAARLPGEYLHEYTLEYITPHEPWAKSWAGGKLRAFFITPFNGAAREVAEVWQRADLEVFGETAASTRELGRAAGCFKDVEGTSPEEKRRRLAAKLSAGRYHVFVIGNVDWAAFPAETQYLMLKQVAEGAGLVIVYPSNVREAILKRPDPAGREWILHGIPLDAVPYFADTMRRLVEGRSMEAVAERLVRTYRAGKGRVVLIDYAARNDFQPCGGGMGLTPLEQFDFERPAYYEVYMALVLRAIHWAAGSVPELQLVGLPKRPMSVAPGEAPLVRVQIMGQPQWRGEALVRWRLVNCWNEPVASGEAPAKLAGGRGEATLRLPRFDGGRYFLRLFLDAAGKRHDFGILALRCRGAARLEEIAPIEDAQPPFGIGLRGRISPAGTRVAVELRDNYDRLFYVTDATAAPRPDREGSFEWRVPDEALALAVSSCVRARVKAFDGARVSDQAEVVLTRAKVLEDEYPVCMWGMMPGYVGHLAAVRIRELGFNIVLGSPTPDFARQLAVHDLGLIPYCTRIWDRRHFHDMDFVEKTEADLERTARSLARFRPHVYSLGDENAIPADFGWTEEDRPLLVEYLRRRYEDDLGALNRAWASNFSTWEEVTAAHAKEARAKRIFVPHHDIAAFREEIYARRHHQYREAIRRGDPEARVGAEGSEEGDLELTVSQLEFWGPYRSIRYNTLLKSIAPRDVVRGNWFGGYRSQRGDPSVLPGFLWNALFDGNNLIQYFALATIETIFNTDYSLAYYNRWFIDDFKALLDGPAQLIQRAAYDFDPVAVLHSQSSRHLAALEGQFGGYDLAHTVLLEALENLQFHVRYLTERHPELIKYGTTKVIFLPSCQALSAATCDALRRFVEDGGLLIADVRPGVADAACRFLDDPPLASVFGVRFGNAPQPGEPDRLEFPPGNTLASVRPDASVQLAGATSMRSVGNVPVLIVNKLGRGRAILLNFGIAQVQTAGNTPVRRVIARLIEELLQDAGVQPQAQVLGDDGRRIPDCRVARFVYGDTVIHGLLLSRGGSSPQACVFTVGRPRHLYDTLERKYLGYAQRAELKLTPSHGKIICALPDRLSAIEVLAPRAAVCGQRLAVQVRLRGGGDRHLLRVYAFDPAGRQRYARTVVAADGPAQAVIPLALNDPPGKWMLVARDVATGVSGSAAIMVAEAGSGGS